jgi:hypothetical protein
VQIVDSDLFGNEATELEPGGWILVESSVSDVAGLFVNFSTDLLLDGAAMSNTPLRSFVFPEIETSTKVRIANPNAEPAEVRLNLVEGSGKISSSLVHEVVANGTLELDLGKDRAKDADGAEYLQVSSSRPVFGFNGLPGQDASGGLTLLYGTDYSAGEQSQSDLSVVNLDNIAGRVTFRLIGDEGLQIGQTRSLKIEAHGKLRVIDPLFFRASGQGYVEITSDGIRLAGSLVVRGADGKTAASALPLVADLQREMVFSHVSSDDLFFTEFVVVNPGPSEAMATIELLGADGIREAAVTRNIAARGRKRMPLTELFPALAGKALAGGYVRIVVDQPVAAYSLTGAGNTRSLLCLPAQEIP